MDRIICFIDIDSRAADSVVFPWCSGRGEEGRCFVLKTRKQCRTRAATSTSLFCPSCQVIIVLSHCYSFPPPSRFSWESSIVAVLLTFAELHPSCLVANAPDLARLCDAPKSRNKSLKMQTIRSQGLLSSEPQTMFT